MSIRNICNNSYDNHSLHSKTVTLPCGHNACKQCINENYLTFTCKCGNEFLTEEILDKKNKRITLSTLNIILIEFEAKLQEFKS
jgi:hypothetical protein